VSQIQHRDAHRVLQIIREAQPTDRHLNYEKVARMLGRNPETDRRAVAQMCDLLDAAAANAQVPLLALRAVKSSKDEINPKAWSKGVTASLREAIIRRSLNHAFTQNDFEAISKSLTALKGFGNKSAWAFIRSKFSDEEFFEMLAVGKPSPGEDAIDDLDSGPTLKELRITTSYPRDPAVRSAVIARAGGACEYCQETGFMKADGTPYLETHHIIHLAADGADRPSNVIALCANHHREVHFGQHQNALELEMREIVRRKLSQ
jgi:hypothetical protein